MSVVQNGKVLEPMELVKKLQCEDPAYFFELVESNLSMFLEFSNYEELAKICRGNSSGVKSAKTRGTSSFGLTKKLKRLSRGPSNAAPSAYQVFNVDLSHEIVAQVFQLIEFLQAEENIVQEGLFRKSGSASRQNELRALLNKGDTICFRAQNFSAHDVASVLRAFLRELPDPLLTSHHIPVYTQICHMPKKDIGSVKSKQLTVIRFLVILLPDQNRALLSDLLRLLNRVASRRDRNRMSENSLGTLFAPLLLCSKETTGRELQTNVQQMSEVVALMIKNVEKVFSPPDYLTMAIDSYFSAKKDNKELNGEATSSDVLSPALVFVDQNRSARDAAKITTETAVAGLYADVQRMPGSSQKKRLVNQFQKYNREENIGREFAIGSSFFRRSAKKTPKTLIKKPAFNSATGLESAATHSRSANAKSTVETATENNAAYNTLPVQKFPRDACHNDFSSVSVGPSGSLNSDNSSSLFLKKEDAMTSNTTLDCLSPAISSLQPMKQQRDYWTEEEILANITPTSSLSCFPFSAATSAAAQDYCILKTPITPLNNVAIRKRPSPNALRASNNTKAHVPPKRMAPNHSVSSIAQNSAFFPASSGIVAVHFKYFDELKQKLEKEKASQHHAATPRSEVLRDRSPNPDTPVFNVGSETKLLKASTKRQLSRNRPIVRQRL